MIYDPARHSLLCCALIAREAAEADGARLERNRQRISFLDEAMNVIADGSERFDADRAV
jgi:hypothetical protein